jgi:TetR/AcrR family transcriptional regulator, tetracycline repressor protein
MRRARGRPRGGTTRSALLAQARQQRRSLPAERFPNLIAAADDLSSDDPDALFEFGLDLMLRGLEPLASKA